MHVLPMDEIHVGKEAMWGESMLHDSTSNVSRNHGMHIEAGMNSPLSPSSPVYQDRIVFLLRISTYDVIFPVHVVPNDQIRKLIISILHFARSLSSRHPARIELVLD
jgi:hypothetical protein